MDFYVEFHTSFIISFKISILLWILSSHQNPSFQKWPREKARFIFFYSILWKIFERNVKNYFKKKIKVFLI